METIEKHFEPIAIYNNKGGKDAEILRQFGEPSWNYQVIRFLNAEGKDIIPRKDRIWTTEALAKRIILTLERLQKPVPPSLLKISNS